MTTIVIKTREQILEEMLNLIDKKIDKTPGYIPFDLSNSVAYEISVLYEIIRELLSMIDVTKLTGDWLTTYVSQRKGIIRKPAVKSVGAIKVISNPGAVISIGDLFETSSGIQFISTEAKTLNLTDVIKIEAVLAGSSGNVAPSSISLMPVTIQNVVSITNDDSTKGGVDEEKDADLIERYLFAVRLPATSGNISHYKIWSLECAGIGDAKIVPLWNGPNTVKVVVIDSNNLPATAPTVLLVQNYIDPKGLANVTWGTGAGAAPVGAYCTVISAAQLLINVGCKIIPGLNYSLQIITDNVKKALIKYFSDIAFKQDYVSYSKISSVIYEVEGVKDVQNLLVNGAAVNISIPNESVAISGTVTIV